MNISLSLFFIKSAQGIPIRGGFFLFKGFYTGAPCSTSFTISKSTLSLCRDISVYIYSSLLLMKVLGLEERENDKSSFSEYISLYFWWIVWEKEKSWDERNVTNHTEKQILSTLVNQEFFHITTFLLSYQIRASISESIKTLSLYTLQSKV